MNKKYVVFLLMAILFLTACNSNQGGQDAGNVSIPEGCPPFTHLGQYWVIDNANVLNLSTIVYADAIFQKLKQDGIAEIVVLIQPGVKDSALLTYATHYGRWLGLGKTGPSSLGGNNGIVYLIVPELESKLTIEPGRGMFKFTISDFGPIVERVAMDFLNYGDYDGGVKTLADETDRVLREIYKPGS
ncbi:MAG: TPM domain-containing protein [Candidatus Paceibacterota bacterium]